MQVTDKMLAMLQECFDEAYPNDKSFRNVHRGSAELWFRLMYNDDEYRRYIKRPREHQGYAGRQKVAILLHKKLGLDIIKASPLWQAMSEQV
jgi:hypothetical protein